MRNFDIRLRTDGHTLVKVDDIQVVQVMVNLLRNAADAMNESGSCEKWIEVQTTKMAGFQVISVTNPGPEIPPEVMKSLFENFFTTKGKKGTGVGLAVSLSIAKELGGDLTAQQLPHPTDAGLRLVRFELTLPSS